MNKEFVSVFPDPMVCSGRRDGKNLFCPELLCWAGAATPQGPGGERLQGCFLG